MNSRIVRLRNFLLFMVLAIYLPSNAQNPFLMNKNTEISVLNIDLSFGETVPLEYRALLKANVENSIKQFNEDKRARYLAKLDTLSATSKLTLRIDSVALVTKKNQTRAIGLSMITAVGLPIAMLASGSEFIVLFWFYPQNQIYSHIELSEDIRSEKYEVLPTTKYVSMSGWFKPLEQNEIDSASNFGYVFKTQLKRINKSVKK